jgi:hypothetical protein
LSSFDGPVKSPQKADFQILLLMISIGLDRESLAAMTTAKPAIPAEAKTALTGMPECLAAL